MDPNPAPMGPLGLDLMLSRVVFGGVGREEPKSGAPGWGEEPVSRKPYVFKIPWDAHS